MASPFRTKQKDSGAAIKARALSKRVVWRDAFYFKRKCEAVSIAPQASRLGPKNHLSLSNGQCALERVAASLAEYPTPATFARNAQNLRTPGSLPWETLLASQRLINGFFVSPAALNNADRTNGLRGLCFGL